MTPQMLLKTVPDYNLALSVGFCVKTIVIHCLHTSFYFLAILPVLFKIEEDLGLVRLGSFWDSFWEGFFSGSQGEVVVSVVVSWFGLDFFHKKETRRQQWVYSSNSEVGWIPGQGLVLQKVKHEHWGLLTPSGNQT